jgi:hypothetical protein
MGVAWGTTIPSLLVNLVLWPPYVCRLVGISTWTYVRQAWLRPLLPAIPFAVVTWYIERAYPPHSILVFFLQVGMALPTFLVALAITYRFEAMQALRLAWNGGDQIVERSPLGSNGKGTLPERSVPARAPMLSRTSPLVSIGVPVYNGERFLARTLDSLQSQTFTDFELIISDNASTDATEEIARSYAARDSRIRYVRNDTNIGAARNFNRVVGLATAPFFKLANADDLAAPELLEACVAELQQNPAAVLVFGHTILIDEDDRHLGIYPDDLHLYQASPSRRLMHFVEHVGQVNALQGVCRRSVLAAVGFSDTWVGADMVLLAKLALAGHFIWLDQPLLFRRMHRAAFSSLPTADHRQAFEDPTVAATTLNRWRILYGYGGAVRTAALPPAEKAAAFGVLVRWTIRNRVNLLGEVRAALRPQS